MPVVIFFKCLDLKPDSVDFEILGACPRIGILFKIEKFKKNKHSHMFDIASIIFLKFRRVWAGKRRLRKRILGQPPSKSTDSRNNYNSRR